LDGYIKLYRKSIENGWLKNGDLWRFWCYCLLKATHKKTTVVVGWQQIELEPGQFIFGRRVAAEDLGMSERKIRTCHHALETMENVTSKTTNKFSIISIVNWDIYQQTEYQNDQQNDQQATSRRPAGDHIQEHKNKRINTYSPEFEQFYAAYPKKRDPDRAWKSWKSRNGSRPEVSILISAINRQKESADWKKENGKYIPYPSTWLNAGAWNNEIEVGSENKLSKKPIITG
jgi:hypothetical protein